MCDIASISSDLNLVPTNDPPLQPNAGLFNRLPPELRLKVWHHLLPGKGDTVDTQASCRTFRPCPGRGFKRSRGQTWWRRYKEVVRHCLNSGNQDTYPPRPEHNLAILRTCKTLHDELTREFYHNRVFTVCFNPQEHSDTSVCFNPEAHLGTPVTFNCGLPLFDGASAFSKPKPRTRFWTTIGEICELSDSSRIDFSRFSSLRINIRFPTYDAKSEPFGDLNNEIAQFSTMIQVWQAEMTERGESPSLNIHVTLAICPRKNMHSAFSREICLCDIAKVLLQLAQIRSVRQGSIQVEFALPRGQEWLSEVMRQAVTGMQRTSDNDFQWLEATGIGEALEFSHKLRRKQYSRVFDTRLRLLPIRVPTYPIPENMRFSRRSESASGHSSLSSKRATCTVGSNSVTKISFTSPKSTIPDPELGLRNAASCMDEEG